MPTFPSGKLFPCVSLTLGARKSVGYKMFLKESSMYGYVLQYISGIIKR